MGEVAANDQNKLQLKAVTSAPLQSNAASKMVGRYTRACSASSSCDSSGPRISNSRLASEKLIKTKDQFEI
jgi:hypothetical protein